MPKPTIEPFTPVNWQSRLLKLQCQTCKEKWEATCSSTSNTFSTLISHECKEES